MKPVLRIVRRAPRFTAVTDPRSGGAVFEKMVSASVRNGHHWTAEEKGFQEGIAEIASVVQAQKYISQEVICTDGMMRNFANEVDAG